MDHLTFAQLLGNYGEFVGAIAVVATLGYLAAQIRQQNMESRQAAMSAVAQGWRDAIGLAGEADIVDLTMRGLEDFDSLNPGERWLLMSRMLNIFRVGEEAFMLRSDGRLDDRYWQGISRYLTTFISIRGVQQMWGLRKHYYYDDYQKFVDGLLDSVGDSSRSYAETMEGEEPMPQKHSNSS